VVASNYQLPREVQVLGQTLNPDYAKASSGRLDL
jgi:hypothetical protein